MQSSSRTALHSRLIHIRRHIASLRTEEAQLEQAIRAIIYPILSIPAELAIAIFKAHVKQAQQDPLVLAQVCGQWRHTALATPELWTNIQSVAELQGWFERTGTCPIEADVRIRCSENWATLNYFLVNYPMRWKSLVCSISNNTQLLLPSTNLPNLRKISLLGCVRPPMGQLTRFASAVEEMLLGPVAFSTHTAGSMFTHLKTLSLDGNPHTCYNILSLAPNLQSLTIRTLTDVDDFIDFEREPLLLSQLQVIAVWQSTSFLDYLNLPALKRVVLACHLDKQDIEVVKSLVARSSCSIRALEFDCKHGWTWFLGILDDFLEEVELRHVRQLTLRNPPEGELCYVLGDTDYGLLPSLETVRIVDYEGLIDLTALALMEERMGDHTVEGMAKLKSWQFLLNSDKKDVEAINRARDIETLLELRSQGKLIIETGYGNRRLPHLLPHLDVWGLNDYLDVEVTGSFSSHIKLF
ncbi:hypothetical protein FB45DRAFT_1023074 [Roridomyces roridus]|uniref:F-box domain-containing protein n=1 Tax=Roridomyces roridus TaxID=1738132 RepID=A0AAD7C3L6_9AGAR|nr:hypothetical protein FB45DRAFT_1023074 [Roridomyces roridus]